MIVMPQNPNSNKAIFWMLTIKHSEFTPYLPPGVNYIKGQLEEGEGGYLHWQIIVGFTSQTRLAGVRKVFGNAHAEPTRSEAADEYVWKESTRVAGTQFVLGQKALRRNNSKDWASIYEAAKRADFEEIPPDVLIRCYGNLCRIASANAQPVGMERTAVCYYGPTGTGKSRRAWEEALESAYPKDPNTKFWCGYRGHENVVIDEFRGLINISNILRWLDRYPVLVEVKGSSVVLNAKRIWLTSNVHPRDWYPNLDPLTVDALLRRMEIIQINE